MVTKRNNIYFTFVMRTPELAGFKKQQQQQHERTFTLNGEDED